MNVNAIAIIMMIFNLISQNNVSYQDAGLYTQAFVVTSVENDVLTMETATGYVYEWEGAQDIVEGDIVTALMFDNGTQVITDDYILHVEYSGFWMY